MTVRRIVVASDPIATALKVGLALPTIDPGESVDLITDGKGTVIGVAKSGPESASPPAAVESAVSHEDIATLKRDLKAMQDLHHQHLATIAELQVQMKQLRASVLGLAPPHP